MLARELAKKTGLPLFHMDQLFWRGDWEEVVEYEYLRNHHELICGDSWIIEGYIDEKMADRLKRSNLIIFLDYPGWLCAWRVIKRWFKYRKTNRPEFSEGAYEKLELKFLWRVFTRRERVSLDEALQMFPLQRLMVFTSPAELKHFIV
ncbi:MAG: hypothetical protein Q7S47_00405 [bacterium]|nr:hypothetical protein [bacterium]